MPLVYIVILNWNDYQSTLSCVESLKSLEYSNYRIFVIDNHSSNESIEKLSCVDGIELYCNPENMGFTGGCNRAIEIVMAAGPDYIWLLNNDTVVAADCLSQLVQTAEQDKSIGLLSPVIYEQDHPDKIQHCGSRFDFDVPEIMESSDVDTVALWQQQYPYNVVLWGTALLVPATTVNKIGLLDDSLFAYAEDLDYAVRSAQSGLKNVTVFNASVWHQTYNGIRKPYYYYYTTRNSFHFWRKYLRFKTYLKVCRWIMARTVKHIANFQAHPEQIKACLLGVWDGLRGVYGVYDPGRHAPSFVYPLLKRLS